MARIFIILSFFILLTRPAVAEMREEIQDTLNLPYLAQRYDVPVSLLHAIKDTESDGNPYAFHLQSRRSVGALLQKIGVRYNSYTKKGMIHYSVSASSYQEACMIIQYVTPLCEKFDTGWFQISEYWIKSQKLNPYDLLNPTYNAAWGAKILSNCFRQEKGQLWNAVECYNRGSSKGRLTSYSQRVYHSHVKQLSARR